MSFKKLLVVSTVVSTGFMGCSNNVNEDSSVAAKNKLYVTSGACYSGDGIVTYTGASTPTASRMITMWNATDGTSQGTFMDLNIGSSTAGGTTPQALVDRGDHVLMLLENASAGAQMTSDRRIVKVYKSDTNIWRQFASQESGAFGAVATNVNRSLVQDSDGTVLFSKSTAIEKLNPLGVRISKGNPANPFVNAAAATGVCATAAFTKIVDVKLMNPYDSSVHQGKIIYAHAGNAVGLNRIGVSQRLGMTSGTVNDCSAGAQLSTTTHTLAASASGSVNVAGANPTAIVYIPTPAPASTTGKLVVTYGPMSTTGLENTPTATNNAIVSWDITEANDVASGGNVTLDNPVILYNDSSIVFGPSAVTYDPNSSSLFVAVASSINTSSQLTAGLGYNIEKFSYNIAQSKVERVTVVPNEPFIKGRGMAKCISNMILGD